MNQLVVDRQISSGARSTALASLSSRYLTGGAAVFLYSFLFILPWWDRYFGLTNEGWYQFFGEQILHGRVPYRDFYLFVPPGQALLMAGLTSVFGDKLIVPELFGFAGALVLVLALYVWLTRFLPQFWSAFAVICTTAIYFRRSTESLSGLHLDANLSVVLALVAATFVAEKSTSIARCVLAGFFAGAALMLKQTGGMAATVAVVAGLPTLVAARSQIRNGLRVLAFLLIGWSIPVGSVFVWLGLNGAFRDFLNDAFLRGASSKGSIASLIGREFHGIFSGRYQEASAGAALVFVLLAAWILSSKRSTDESEISLVVSPMLPVAGFTALAIALTFYAQHSPHAWPSRLPRLDQIFKYAPNYLGEFGSLAILLVYGAYFFRRKLQLPEEQLLFAAGASFASAFLSSFSWASAGTMLVPAFPLVAAFGLSHLTRGRFAMALRAGAVAVGFLCVAIMAGSKMREPYSWANWQEGDSLRAIVRTGFPELAGIKVTPETANFLTHLVSDIQQYSGSSDPIAEVPDMPVLYALAHRAPMTFAFIHYIDVTPDSVYEMDATGLQRNPPAVMVLFQRTDAEIREGEVNFRDGRTSGERRLWATIDSLRCHYRIADVLQTPNTNRPVEVWVLQQDERHGLACPANG